MDFLKRVYHKTRSRVGLRNQDEGIQIETASPSLNPFRKVLRFQIFPLGFARIDRFLLQVDVGYEPRHLFQHLLRYGRKVDEHAVFVLVVGGVVVQQDARYFFVVHFRERFDPVAQVGDVHFLSIAVSLQVFFGCLLKSIVPKNRERSLSLSLST